MQLVDRTLVLNLSLRSGAIYQPVYVSNPLSSLVLILDLTLFLGIKYKGALLLDILFSQGFDESNPGHNID